jgi:tellurite resistance protein TerC
MTVKKALFWVSFWAGLALACNAGVYFIMGKERALEFLGGYIIEQSLSLDNLFLFLLIFGSFGVQTVHQRRVLNYGIIGAVVLRLIFIVLGVAVVSRFSWVLHIFGVILLVSGIKIFFKDDEEKDFKESRVLKMLGKIIPISPDFEGEKFFVRKNKLLYATPLLAILVLIEVSDIIFAIDSIPAIFSITTNPYIIFSSNLFAILGLRSIYFLLEKMHKAFHFMQYGVAFILIFTGLKLTLLFFHIEISLVLSILIIFGILVLSILASVFFKPPHK